MSQSISPPVAVPPGARPNPAYQQWLQASQAAQAVITANQQKQAQFDAACDLIRKDGIRGFKLDIEADSTVAADEQAEQQSRTMFLKEIIPLLQQIAPIAQGNPSMAKLAGEVGMFAIRGFRVARTLEEAFEEAFKTLGAMPPPQPKGAGNAQVEQAKIAADVHDTQTTAQTDTLETQTKAQIAQATLAQKEQQVNDQMAMERERFQAEQNHNAAQLALENERLRSGERLQSARTAATEARSGSGLV